MERYKVKYMAKQKKVNPITAELRKKFNEMRMKQGKKPIASKEQDAMVIPLSERKPEKASKGKKEIEVLTDDMPMENLTVDESEGIKLCYICGGGIHESHAQYIPKDKKGNGPFYRCHSCEPKINNILNKPLDEPKPPVELEEEKELVSA
jgi:hypothetical protein